jgi:uncharacterized protein (DUF488 family)
MTRDSTIYSIGHGNKELNTFLNELKSFNISFVIDIRSKPYSKWNPQFNQEKLKNALLENNITYVFLGKQLGGLPDDPSCYIDGKVIYDLIKEKDFFKEGIKRLITANNKRINVAVMCSESKPKECHRSKLIGQELLKKDISMKHIIKPHTIKSQETIISEITKGEGTIDLFGKEKDFTSRKAYDK